MERLDAFLQDWSTIRHPPWCLILRCLKKAKDQQATLFLITPNWSAQLPKVSNGSHDVDRLPKVSTSTGQPPSAKRQCKSPANANSAESGRMAHFWRSLTNKGFSSKVEKLLSSSWRKGTHKNHDSAWRKWEQWCINKHVSPISSS